MKLGLYQGSVPSNRSMQECVSLTAELGFDGLEISLEDPGPLLSAAMDDTTPEILAIGQSIGMTTAREGALDLNSSLQDLTRVSEMAAEAGIQIHSVATMMLFFYPLSSPISSTRARGIQIVLDMLKAASVLGADTILVVPGLVTTSTGYREALQRSRDVIRDLVPEASRLGIVMAIENVWNRFLLSPLEMADYIDSFESPYVGAYFDVGNVLAHGYPDDWLRILGPRVKGIHFKDFRRDIGNILGFTHLLHGDVDWDAVTGALGEIGYTGYITVEVPPLKNRPLKGLRDARSSLDLILSRLSD
jgi:hexulose-6-phosphate isomerase